MRQLDRTLVLAVLSISSALATGAIGCASEPEGAPIGSGAGAPTTSAGSGGTTSVGGMTVIPSGGTTTTTTAGSTTGGVSDSGSSGSSTAGSAQGGASGGSTGVNGGSAGASGGSAGASGGTASGGSGGGGSADCSAYKLCDDFEGGALGMGTSPWKTQSGGGYTIALATDQAHSGTHSVHVSAPTATGSAHIQETKTFPAADFWGRSFLRFKAPPGGHQMFIALAAPGDQIRILNMLGNTAKVQQNLQSSDVFKTSNTLIPMEKWFCYEWHASSGGVHVYLDGTELTDAVATWSAANATSLLIGFQRFQAGTGAGELWIDDVAINSTQIGCK